LLFETDLIVSADSATQSASTAVNTPDAINCAVDANNDWINPTDSFTQNNVYTYVTNSKFDTTDVTERLDNTNFGFNIPTGSTIDGIEVSMDRYMSTGGANDYFLKLFKAGILMGDNKSVGAAWAASDTDTYVTFGSPTELWGTTWTEADIENISFGVALCAQATADRTDVHVDHITITVYYSLAATPTPTPTTTPTPDPSATPTPTPTPRVEGPAVEVIGGGGNSPTRIIFTGEVFPAGMVSVFLIGEEYGQVQIGETYIIGSDGKFEIEIISPVEEKRLYSLFVEDPDGVPAKSKFFNYDLEFNTIVRQEDLIFAPTININKTRFTRNEIMLISGYAAPGNTAELVINGETVKTVDVENDGLYRIDINTNDLTLGLHNIQTRQVDDETGKISDYSPIKKVNLSLFSSLNCDLNDDFGISISDWSIFLLNWLGGTAETKAKIDFNGDGEVGIEDFSLFLQCWRLNN